MITLGPFKPTAVLTLKLFMNTLFAGVIRILKIYSMMGFGILHHFKWYIWYNILLSLRTLLTLPTPTLCINTLFYFQCKGFQELKNIAHDGL